MAMEFDRHLAEITSNLEEAALEFASHGDLTHARIMTDALLLIHALQAKSPKAD